MVISSDEPNIVKQAVPRLWSPSECVEAETIKPPSALNKSDINTVRRKKDSVKTAPRSVAGRTSIATEVKLDLVCIDDDASSLDSGQLNSRKDQLRYSPTIHEMPADERPRERLYRYGELALSTAELIAIIIQSGTSERSSLSLAEMLLAQFGSIKGIACAPVEQLRTVKGLGSAKAAQIKAAIAFGQRLAIFSEDGGPQIASPGDAYNLLAPEMRYLKKEVFKSLLLDTKNKVIGARTVSVGDLTSSIVNPREVFKDAIVASAASMIVAHNHPSGDPTPSHEDVNVTKRLMEAGKILDIEVLDHIVIGDGCFVSLKERALV